MQLQTVVTKVITTQDCYLVLFKLYFELGTYCIESIDSNFYNHISMALVY